MWNNTSGVLYFQVGIGDGNGKNFIGDHDLWRLPEIDDFIDFQGILIIVLLFTTL